MRYIGPFFRMNSLSTKEIKSQLFYLSKEALKHLVLESRCGIIASLKNSKKYLSNNDINILKDFSPLLCIYKKGRPKFTSTKHFHSWSEDNMKSEILCSSNALMTYCILNFVDYYNHFKGVNDYNYGLSNIYKALGKLQLDFYLKHLRNGEGVFISKKNISTTHSDFNLCDIEKKFKLSDQAFMMNAFYYYWKVSKDDKNSEEYKIFSMEILNMFLNFREELLNVSFEESLKLLTSFNSFYKLCPSEDLKNLIIDFTDYMIDKFEEKNYILNDIDYSSMFSINLYLSYKNTNLYKFKDYFIYLSDRHVKLYDEDKGIILKNNDKKQIKYSSFEIITYLMNMILYNDSSEEDSKMKSLISTFYKSSVINSGIVLSWPDAPSLDSEDRYINLSLNADDLLEETMFKMASSPSPESIGLAPIFIKNVSYSKKKDEFSISKSSFDSSKNMFIFFLFIILFKDEVLDNLFTSKRDSNDSNIDLEENNIIIEENTINSKDDCCNTSKSVDTNVNSIASESPSSEV